MLVTLEELARVNELRGVLEASEAARGFSPKVGGFEYSDHGMSHTDEPSCYLSDDARLRIMTFIDGEYFKLSQETLEELERLGISRGEFMIAPPFSQI